MDRAQFPERSCRDHVWGPNNDGHNCELVDLHHGPCASLSVKASVQRREKWEASNPDWRSNMQSGDPFQ